MGLTDHRTDYCANLSGGQRTRVSLACALVCHPTLLVLDEPTVGLDPVLRVDLWQQFTELARARTTLLISSHVMDEAEHCGDLLLMRAGRLVAHTTSTPTTKGHRMHVAGGGVSLHDPPPHHHAPGRIGPRAYTATTTRIPRQLAADHRSVAMALPVLTAPLRRLDLLAGLPQLLLAGIIVPRAVMPTWLEWVSNAMPASCALEALQQVGAHPELTYIALRDIVVVVVFAVASLCLAAATLRRRMS